MSREVEYGIKVTAVDSLSAPMEQATEAVEKFEKATTEAAAASSKGLANVTSSAQSMVSSLAPAIVAAGAVAAAFGLVSKAAGFVTDTVSQVVRLAMEQERVERRAVAAITAKVDLTRAEFDALQAANSERQRALGIGDETQLQVQGTLAALGVQKQALNAATEATIGLSEVTGQGLNEAARAVGKALTGNIGVLQEYGIKATSVTDATEKLAAMFGVAMAQSDTLQSRLAALEAAYGDLQEEIGKLITNSPAVRQSLDALTLALQDLIGWFGSPEGRRAAQLFFGEIAGGAGDAINAILGAKRALQDLSGEGDRTSMMSRVGGAFDFVQQAVDLPAFLVAQATGKMDQAQAKFDDAYRRMMGVGGPRPADSPMMQMLEQLANRLTRVSEEAKRASKEIVLDEIVITPTGRPTGVGGGGGIDAKAAEERAKREEEERRKREEAIRKHAERIARIEREAGEAQRAYEESRTNYLIELTNKQAEEREASLRLAVERQREIQDQATRDAAATAERMRSVLEGLGMGAIDLLGDAFAMVGRLQTETMTEIVRNEKGLLEERTRVTRQYVADAGDAMAAFFTDFGQMLLKAVLNEIAVLMVRGAVNAIVNEVGRWGPLGLITGGIAAAGLVGALMASKESLPSPPQYFTGGVVPGPIGRRQMAIVESGERVTSIADRVDGRGSGNATVVINNNLLAAPSRVQMERVNRDAVMPSMRRLQRLGFAS